MVLYEVGRRTHQSTAWSKRHDAVLTAASIETGGYGGDVMTKLGSTMYV